MSRRIETSLLGAASPTLTRGSLNLMLLSEDDLHVRSSTSSELVVGLNLRPGFVVLWYQTPSVLLDIKEFLLFLSLAWVEKLSDVCHACQRTILPTGWFSASGPVSTCRVGLAWPPVRAPGATFWGALPIRTPLSRARGRRSSDAALKNQKGYNQFFMTAQSRVERRAFSQHAQRPEIKSRTRYKTRTCYK